MCQQLFAFARAEVASGPTSVRICRGLLAAAVRFGDITHHDDGAKKQDYEGSGNKAHQEGVVKQAIKRKFQESPP